MNVKPFRVIGCSEWGARLPTHAAATKGRPKRVIFHHTAGHFAELDHHSGESYAEAVAYVRAIQNFHMNPPPKGRGWADTGQNFTVTRNGYIFEGRHGSFAQISKGKMIESAHCPGQNDQPGVEIEHLGGEAMTKIQHEAAVWLFAWICKACAIPATQIFGHKDFFATSCPGPLYSGLPQFRKDVAVALKPPVPTYLVTATNRDGKTVTTHTRTPWTYGNKHFSAGSFKLAKASIQIIENG